MYLVWINPPINFTFSDDSVFLKKIFAGDINSLNLLVTSVFAFTARSNLDSYSLIWEELVDSHLMKGANIE